MALALAGALGFPSASLGNGSSAVSPRVMGGANAPWSGAYKSVGFFVARYSTRGWNRRADSLFAFCSGTLIRPTVVLTAAHCLRGRGIPKYPAVVFGKKRMDSLVEGTRRYVSEKLIHPAYDSRNVVADVGLALLSRPATGFGSLSIPQFRPEAAPLLPQRDDVVAAAGWGRSTRKGFTGLLGLPGPRLKISWGYLGDSQFCKAQSSLVGSNQFCMAAGRRIGTACDGDSGGPLLLMRRAPQPADDSVKYAQPQAVVGVNSYRLENRRGKSCSASGLSVFQSLSTASPLNFWVKQQLAQRGL